MSVFSVHARPLASVWQHLRTAGMWLFLGPLIVVLGTIDALTNGRSRNWPFRDRLKR